MNTNNFYLTYFSILGYRLIQNKVYWYLLLLHMLWWHCAWKLITWTILTIVIWLNFPSTVPDVNITTLQCEDKSGKLKCSADLNGGCESYNGPDVHINFTLHTTLPCSDPLTILNKSAEIKNNKAEVQFSNYLAGVKYEVKATVGNIAGAGHSKNTTFSTEDKRECSTSHMSCYIIKYCNNTMDMKSYILF